MIEKNQQYEIEIVDLGHSGEGIGRIDGFTVFVEGGLPGDRLLVEITTLKKNYAIGTLHKILNPSEYRIEPPCTLADRCGGCQLMHMSYQGQLEIKGKQVEETLRRIGKVTGVVHPVLGMENPYEYRNKAQFPVGMESGQVVMGFYQKGSHIIVDTPYCMIQHPVNRIIAEAVKEFINRYHITIYNEKTGKGLLRHLVTRVGYSTGEVMVILVVNGKALPHHQELVAQLRDKVPNLKSVVLNINEKNTNVIMGRETITLAGSDTIEDTIGPLKFKISAQSFFQVNPQQTQVLYQKALDYAGLTGEETVFDIYCGIGTISLFLAHKAKQVYGIEIVEAAIEDAKENARINGIENAEFYGGAAEKVIPALYDQGYRADVVVVDPPRKGCEPIVLDTIAYMAPKRIVYVSCNPATLARDLAILEEKGYRTIEVQPVDMFPWTAHVECIVQIKRAETRMG